MSVENRIFWLVVGIGALYLVIANTGRGYVQRFVYGIFGYGGSAGIGTPTPATPNPNPTLSNPSGVTGDNRTGLPWLLDPQN